MKTSINKEEQDQLLKRAKDDFVEKIISIHDIKLDSENNVDFSSLSYPYLEELYAEFAAINMKFYPDDLEFFTETSAQKTIYLIRQYLEKSTYDNAEVIADSIRDQAIESVKNELIGLIEKKLTTNFDHGYISNGFMLQVDKENGEQTFCKGLRSVAR